MRAWQADARPLPVAASRVWQAAAADSCAVVIDVAGPVPLAVEGARLAALASGEAAPAPVRRRRRARGRLRRARRAACRRRRSSCALAAPTHDLVIALTLSAEGAGHDVTELATGVGNAVMERLGGRLRRGVAIWLGRRAPALSLGTVAVAGVSPRARLGTVRTRVMARSTACCAG